MFAKLKIARVKTGTPQPTAAAVRYALPSWSFRLSRQPRRAAA